METPWIIIAIGIFIIILGIVAIIAIKSDKKKTPIDYYMWFIMGIIWTGVGIPLKNFALSTMGIIFTIVGLIHKKEWKKNHEANKWKNLTGQQRKFKMWIIWGLTLLLLVGILVLYLAKKNMG